MTVIRDTDRQDDFARQIRSLAAKQDIDSLAALPKDQLEHRRAAAAERLEQREDRALDAQRDLTGREAELSKADAAEIQAIDTALTLVERSETQHRAVAEGLDLARRNRLDEQPIEHRTSNPLAVSGKMLSAVQEAMETRTAGVFDVESVEHRAALTTTTYGAPREWGSNILSAPRTLWETAGIPMSPAMAPTAQYPKLTLPAVDAGVAEGVSIVEFAASTGGTVTLKRYGRFTDFTRESLIGADAGAVIAAHRTAIARDLDSALITLINTDAGSAVGFTADVPAAIRKAIATVADNTAAADGQIMVLANPADVALLQSVTSTGGRTIGEDFPRFAGALVYASAAVPTGFMLVGNLATACRFWSAGPVETRTFPDVKTSVLTVGTDMIGGFGTAAISGYVSKVDVVTP
jgi:hypothetical protein